MLSPFHNLKRSNMVKVILCRYFVKTANLEMTKFGRRYGISDPTFDSSHSKCKYNYVN